MKSLPFVLPALFALGSSASAQMGAGHGGDMMGGWGWGMNSGLLIAVVIVALVIIGIVYMFKQRQ